MRTLKAWEKVLAASMQARAAKTIVWAVNQVKPDASVAQLNYCANHIDSFAMSAADFLERGDISGLNGAISTLNYAVRDLPKAGPPKLPLVPPGDTVFYNAGWSSAEELGLKTILLKGLNGVTVGDRCIAVDGDGASLASGKRVSKKAALEAYIPPAGGKMVMVGSLPAVMNTVLKMNAGAKS